MENFPDHARYQRSEEFVARTIAGETVLVPIRQRLGDLESIYTLNEVATFIWERLADQATVVGVAAAVEAEFAGDPSQIRLDLEEFLGQLVALGAIRPIDGTYDAPGPTPRP
jgi:coenzyme PQQ synthesis protein D (PqqD)